MGKLQFVVATYAIGDYVPYVHSDYRFGYNGMEIDPEMKGAGNSYTTEFRQYDPRLGRWMSLDPLMASFPWQSPYNGFDDNPILLTDPSGLGTEDWVKPKGSNEAYQWSNDITTPEQAETEKMDFIAAGTVIEASLNGGEKGYVYLGHGAKDAYYVNKPVDLEEVSISPSNTGNLSDLLPEDEGIPEKEGSYSGLGNVNLDYFGDGFTTRNAVQKSFDVSLRTSWQRTVYKLTDYAPLALPVGIAAPFVVGYGIIYGGAACGFIAGGGASDAALFTYLSAESAATGAVNFASKYWLGRVALTGGSIYMGSNLYNLRTTPGPVPSYFTKSISNGFILRRNGTQPNLLRVQYGNEWMNPLKGHTGLGSEQVKHINIATKNNNLHILLNPSQYGKWTSTWYNPFRIKP